MRDAVKNMNTKGQKKYAELEHLLAERWPGTAKNDDDDVLYIGRAYATYLMSADKNLPIELGKFIDRKQIERLLPALMTVCQLLRELSGQGRLELRWTPDPDDPLFGRSHVLDDFEYLANRMLEQGQQALRAHEDLSSPDQRTHWRAVSVLKACAAIWENEEGKPAPKLNNDSQHGTGFGEFVKSVYSVLGFAAQPNTAQKALARWEAEQRGLT